MKKVLTFADLSTSIQSGMSNRQTNLSTSNIQIRSASLRKAISRLKQENRISIMGISSICKTQIPKNQSYFQIKQESKHNRISNPSQEPHLNINQFDHKQDTLRGINQLQQYCKSQKALEIAMQKYSLKKSYKVSSDMSTVPTLVDKLNRDLINSKSKVIQEVMKEELRKRIPKKQKEINYELDSMFKNYKSFAQLCLSENASIQNKKVYNGYLKVYNSGKNDRIFLDKIEERKKSLSDESEEYGAFLGETDEATIQRDVYNNNIRNPFLDDKVTVITMKKDGFLKRRVTQS
ncbi:unnamed protein product (macronuclear) [Paramecium tetraurelia]|uniref:Uncharacterized protein n=1 Tax=Paramecium tetraurelia TaxID=5888 RepID=A0D9N5_PARTE|nr:uncharacterized protein GSPATT00014682001 [Paramecium tetraurelia]CAK79752.1 unnamed protein product [Paramecium tetraurelia]|eukprot:XP_001447149.1 hypothetical protein (macronuclear) [Paramecium tetraurelia strain d4-2]